MKIYASETAFNKHCLSLAHAELDERVAKYKAAGLSHEEACRKAHLKVAAKALKAAEKAAKKEGRQLRADAFAAAAAFVAGRG